MDFWDRLDFIDEVNYTYHDKGGKKNFINDFWGNLYLSKVNICLFFGWESTQEPDSDWISGFAYFDEEARCDGLAPRDSWDWKEICTTASFTDWHYGILENCNY